MNKCSKLETHVECIELHCSAVGIDNFNARRLINEDKSSESSCRMMSVDICDAYGGIECLLILSSQSS